MSARMRLLLSILAVLAVVFVGTAGYMVIEADRDIDFLDAVYMTVITVSTVGYEAVWKLSRPAKIWTIGVIAFGVVTVSLAFTSLVSLVVSGELRSLRERKKMDKALKQVHDHVIVCGHGRMGELVAEELHRRDVPLVVVENKPKHEADLREAHLQFVIGDATDENTLLRAGLMQARAIVIGLPTDADNVYAVLTARTLRPDLTIVARAEQPSTEAKLIRAGATRVVCPQVIGATKIANILTRPTVVDFVEVASRGVDLEIDEYVIGDQSPLVGKTLRDSRIRRTTGSLVVAIKRADGESLVGPDPDSVLGAGDTLILVGPAGVSSRLKALDSAE